jgi:hypothetical protein
LLIYCQEAAGLEFGRASIEQTREQIVEPSVKRTDLFMRPFIGTCIVAFALFARLDGAQSTEVDFSGRWVLVASRPVNPQSPDTLEISAAEELVITQTSLAITIETKGAIYPERGRFEFGSGGFVGDGIFGEGRWGNTFFGTQLMMSKSTTTHENGVETTVARGSFWSIDELGRLIIEFREERSRQRPKTATRVYQRKR